MPMTECPWCEGTATIYPGLTTLACDDCLVVVQIAPDPTLIVTLAAA